MFTDHNVPIEDIPFSAPMFGIVLVNYPTKGKDRRPTLRSDGNDYCYRRKIGN